MDTVTLYRINCYHAPREELIGESFSLVPWDEDDATMKGEDDGGKDYELPKGYELSAEDGVPVNSQSGWATLRFAGAQRMPAVDRRGEKACDFDGAR